MTARFSGSNGGEEQASGKGGDRDCGTRGWGVWHEAVVLAGLDAQGEAFRGGNPAEVSVVLSHQPSGSNCRCVKV